MDFTSIRSAALSLPTAASMQATSTQSLAKTTSTWTSAASVSNASPSITAAAAAASNSQVTNSVSSTGFILGGVVGGALMLAMLGILIYASSPKAFRWLERKEREKLAAEAAAARAASGYDGPNSNSTMGHSSDPSSMRTSRKLSIASLASSSRRPGTPISTSFTGVGGIHDMEEGQRSARGSSRQGSAYGVPGTPISFRASSRRPSASSIRYMMSMEERSESYYRMHAAKKGTTFEVGMVEFDNVAASVGGAETSRSTDYSGSDGGTMSTASGTNSASHSGTSKPRRTFERTRGDDSSDYIYVSDSGIMTSGNIYRVPSHSSIPGFPIGSKRWSELPPPPPDMESAGPSMSKASKRKSVGEAFIQAGAYIRDLRKSNSFNNGPASIKGAEYTSSPNALSRPSSVSSSSSKTGLPRVFSAPNVASLQQRPASAIGNRQISPLSSGARNVPAVGKRGSATGADGDRGRWSIGAPDPNSASAMLTFRSRSVDYTDRGGSMFVDGGDDVGETQGQYVPGHPGWHSAFAMYSPAAMTPQMLPGMMDSAGSVFADGEEEHTTMQRPPPMPSMGFTRIPGAVGVFPGYASPVYHDSRMSSPRRPNSVGGMQMPMASIGGMFADGDDFPTTERPRFSFMGDDADGDADEDDEEEYEDDDEGDGEPHREFQAIESMPADRSSSRTSVPSLPPFLQGQLPPPQFMAYSQSMMQPYHPSLVNPPMMPFPPNMVPTGPPPPGFHPAFFHPGAFHPGYPLHPPLPAPEMMRTFSDEASNSSSIYYAASSRAASPGAFRVAVGGAQSGDESDSVQAPMSALPTITEANDEERGVEQKQTKRSKRTDASKKDAKLRFIGNGVVPITTQPLSSNTPNSVLGNILGMDVDNAQPPSSTSTTASTQFNEPTHPTRSTISPSSTRSLQRPSGNRPPRVSNGSVPSAANTLTSDTSSSSPRSSSTKPRPTVSTLDHARSIVRDIEEEVQRALSPVVPPSPVYRKEDMTKMVEMIEDEVRKSFAVSTPSSTGMLSAAAEGKEVTYVAVDSMERTVDVKGFSGGNGGKGVKEDVVGKKKGWWKR